MFITIIITVKETRIITPITKIRRRTANKKETRRLNKAFYKTNDQLDA